MVDDAMMYCRVARFAVTCAYHVIGEYEEFRIVLMDFMKDKQKALDILEVNIPGMSEGCPSTNFRNRKRDILKGNSPMKWNGITKIIKCSAKVKSLFMLVCGYQGRDLAYSKNGYVTTALNDYKEVRARMQRRTGLESCELPSFENTHVKPERKGFLATKIWEYIEAGLSIFDEIELNVLDDETNAKDYYFTWKKKQAVLHAIWMYRLQCSLVSNFG